LPDKGFSLWDDSAKFQSLGDSQNSSGKLSCI